MLHTLYTKLALGLVLLLLSIGIVYAVLSISTTRQYLQQIDQQLNRDLSHNLVMDRNLVEAGRINEQALKDTFMQYMVINPSIEIYLLDLDGTILSYSADPGKVKRKKVSLGPIQAFLSGKEQFPLLGDDPRSHDRRKAFSVTQVPSAENPQGYLYVVLRGEQYDDEERLIYESNFLRLSAWAVAGSLLFGLLAGLLLFRVLTRRLNVLSAHMDDFRRNDFSQFTPSAPTTGSEDEIDRLANTFDQMAQRISEHIVEQKKQDTLRRELVANVSHDLRTPLAIMHGYLETLKLKSAELDQAKREQYLDAALRNSQHMGTLVSALFELAKLESQDGRPESEAFPFAELAQDVLQKFQLRADELTVRLEFAATDGLPFVYADIALIERVLENLLANALSHTPQGGTVSVSLEPAAGAVRIQVSDTGSGISDEDKPNIFDRFYRAGNKHRDVQHAGLGLAITKRILELHGCEISFSSQLGQGTTFSFSLPVVSDIGELPA